ncbi:uncharacterized protein LOC127775840 [Oryza glaberrima]|uniref:uncharacterized protein LOC127775840 n=1 Tax=Oryza glaberrima TaxID=4538 RepID=UPI00224BE8A8|nr:uncharacterized protein LOC127775840 [Oryza glaberrima]
MRSSRRGGKAARGAAPGCDVRSRLSPQFAPHHMLASFLLVGHRRPSTARGSPRSIRAERGSPPPYQQLVQLDGEAADPAVAFDPAGRCSNGGIARLTSLTTACCCFPHSDDDDCCHENQAALDFRPTRRSDHTNQNVIFADTLSYLHKEKGHMRAAEQHPHRLAGNFF